MLYRDIDALDTTEDETFLLNPKDLNYHKGWGHPMTSYKRGTGLRSSLCAPPKYHDYDHAFLSKLQSSRGYKK